MAKAPSNPDFLSRSAILAEINNIESADLEQFFFSESQKIKEDLQGGATIGSLTGNRFLDRIGLTSGAVLPISYEATRDLTIGPDSFPKSMPLKNLLALKDANGNWQDTNSIKPFTDFFSVFSQRDDNKYATGAYKDGFYQSISSTDYPRSMSEVSIRLLNILERGVASESMDMDSLRRFSQQNLTHDDIYRGIKSGSIKDHEVPSAYLCAAHPGYHARLRSVYIAALNHRLSEYYSEKVANKDYNSKYSDLVKIAHACQEYARSHARLSIKMDLLKQENRKVLLEKNAEIIRQAMVDKSLAGQKTHTQYGRTVRFDPNKPMLGQLEKIRAAYKPWVSKKIDADMGKGLGSCAAAAIAYSNGRSSVTPADVRAAEKAIASARNNVGEYNSTKEFLSRLAGSEEAGKKLTSHMNSAAKGRKGLIGEIESLATKLATYKRGEVPGSSGVSSSRTRTNTDDRIMGQAVAATAILRAGNRMPSLKTINGTLNDFGMSVNRAKEQVKYSSALKQGLAVNLGKAEGRGKGTIAIDVRVRERLNTGAQGVTAVYEPKAPSRSREEMIDSYLAKKGLMLKAQSQAKPEAEAPKPKIDPDGKGPKV